jgi:predicted alpha/beta superfamily hydrolase
VTASRRTIGGVADPARSGTDAHCVVRIIAAWPEPRRGMGDEPRLRGDEWNPWRDAGVPGPTPGQKPARMRHTRALLDPGHAMPRLLLAALLLTGVAACDPSTDALPPADEVVSASAGTAAAANVPLPPAPAPLRSAADGQRAGGLPYEMPGTEVWDAPDPVSGRRYQVFVALPPSYASRPDHRYPVVYVTDADYGFPVLRQIARRLNGHGDRVEEFILVGLSYAVGEDAMDSRRRDYTPTAAGAHDAPTGAVHGHAEKYAAYLREQVFPLVAARYRIDEPRRFLVGHSYGGLLGMHILLTEPASFAGYLIGSPSLWYDGQVMDAIEQRYAAANTDLAASVFIYVGDYEDMKPGDPRFAKRHNMVADARRMAHRLASRRYPSLQLELRVLNDEDHLSVAPRGFTRGLIHLFGRE